MASNLKTGVNPNTGKEFFIFEPEDSTFNLNPKTYQTRIGAEKAKTVKGSVILAKDNIKSYVERCIIFQKKAKRSISNLQTQISNLSEATYFDKEGIEHQVHKVGIERIKKQIQKIEKNSLKDLSTFKRVINL